MRTSLCLVIVLVSALFGRPQIGAAQSVASPTIQSVTLHPDTGVVTITGTGLGADLVVIIDGEPVTILPGAIATQVDVQPPATVLTTPGTYRLTVADPARRVGDVFVVASQPPTAGLGSAAFSGTPTAASGAASASVEPTIAGPAAAAVRAPAVGFAPLTIEDSAAPFRTAIGFEALFSNTTGQFNTAAGYKALELNTTGSSNSAHGAFALSVNTTGRDNTAAGYLALTSNTTGSSNSAHGALALAVNTTGAVNTASGSLALFSNTTGNFNTATGRFALFSNTTGQHNTAVGAQAGESATTGSYNVFLGSQVSGDAGDTNTIRIGLPYETLGAGTGQKHTFIAGIYGTPLNPTAAYPVYIDANGKLGTLGVTGGAGGYLPMSPFEQQVIDQQQQLHDQQAVIDDLRARLSRIEALLYSTTRRK